MSRTNELDVNIKIHLVLNNQQPINVDLIKTQLTGQIKNTLMKFVCLNPEFCIDENILIDMAFQHLVKDIINLSAEDKNIQPLKEDYKVYEYNCFDKIYIPGIIPLKRSNILRINENEVKIGDYLFVLFLRLVVELKKEKGGWGSIYTLKEEGIIADELRYQIYSNLRRGIEGSLLTKNGNLFIQNDGSSNYRISTHPDLVRYDKAKLLRHSSDTVRRLAEELP